MIGQVLSALGLGSAPKIDGLSYAALRTHLADTHAEIEKDSAAKQVELERQLNAVKLAAEQAKAAEATRVADLLTKRKVSQRDAFVTAARKLVSEAGGDRFTRAAATAFADAWRKLDSALHTGTGEHANVKLLAFVLIQESDLHAFSRQPSAVQSACGALARAVERNAHPAEVSLLIEALECAVHAAIGDARPATERGTALGAAFFGSATERDAQEAYVKLEGITLPAHAPDAIEAGRLLSLKRHEPDGSVTRLS